MKACNRVFLPKDYFMSKYVQSINKIIIEWAVEHPPLLTELPLKSRDPRARQAWDKQKMLNMAAQDFKLQR